MTVLWGLRRTGYGRKVNFDLLMYQGQWYQGGIPSQT